MNPVVGSDPANACLHGILRSITHKNPIHPLSHIVGEVRGSDTHDFFIHHTQISSIEPNKKERQILRWNRPPVERIKETIECALDGTENGKKRLMENDAIRVRLHEGDGCSHEKETIGNNEAGDTPKNDDASHRRT